MSKKKLSKKDLKSKASVKKDSFISSMWNLGYTYVGNSLSECEDVIFSLESYYRVQKMSTEAQAYKTKITSWVGNRWIVLKDSNEEVVDDKELLKKVLSVFKCPTLKLFKEKYFVNYYASWELYFYPQMNTLWDISAQIIDSRTMLKKVDDNGNVIKYKQFVGWKTRDIPEEKVYNSIVRYNSDNPYYGASVYESVLYDALSEKESSKKSYYFFRNNSMPNVLFMLNPEFDDPEQITEIERKIEAKYKGTQNSSKFMMSNAVTDAKVLDMSNKDLDLINLREFFIQKMGIVFQIDPRLIGFVKDVGSYASIKEIRQEASETLQSLSNDMEADINNFYRKFIDSSFPYFISLKSETFNNRNEIEENQRKDIETWLQTVEMVWEERWYDTNKLPAEAKVPLIRKNLSKLEDV